MNNYDHAYFSASSRDAFRAGIVNAMRADLEIDAEVADYNITELGVVRHGVWVNGRHIGYEAAFDADGNLRVTDLQPLGTPVKDMHIRSMEELRERAGFMRLLNA